LTARSSGKNPITRQKGEMAMNRSTTGTTADLWFFTGAAGQRKGQRTSSVHFADLDLSRKDDVKVLYRRIRAAADSVCSPLAHSHRLSIHRKWTACRATQVAMAVAEIDHPGLTEYHRKMTSSPMDVD
jgi:UrcA family protein